MRSGKIRWPIAFLAGLAVVACAACTQSEAAQVREGVDQASRFAREGAQAEGRGEDGGERDERTALRLFRDGRRIFRFDTFGDEGFWGDTLRLHRRLRAPRSAASARVTYRGQAHQPRQQAGASVAHWEGPGG